MLAAGEVPAVSEVVFLLDVDNTLLDNDRFAEAPDPEFPQE